MQFDPNQLSALSSVLRLGSFEAAAAALHVTPSAISQRIKALEERVGASLVNRGSPCSGTPQGLRIARHAEEIGLLEASLARELALDSSSPQRHLRIAVNADSLATWLVPAMAELPDLLFDLELDDQDHSAEWLKRGEVSAAVTTARSIPGCDAFALGSLRYLATASPGFHAKWFADGVNETTLNAAPVLTFNAKDMLQKQWMAAQGAPRAAPPAHFLASTQAFVDAAIHGMGWGMNPAALVRGPIRRGRLMPLIEKKPLDVPLVWQVSRVLAPALAPVTRAMIKIAKGALVQPET